MNFICRYQNELYYNDFDGFLVNNKTLKNLIENCYDASIGYKCKSDYAENQVEKFIKSFPEYETRRNDIRNCFITLFEVVFSTLHDTKYSEDVRIITNCMENGFSELAYVIASSTDKQNNDINEIKLMIGKFIQYLEQHNGFTNNSPVSITADKSLKSSKYYTTISEIEERFQRKYLFKQAIDNYCEIINEIYEAADSFGSVEKGVRVNIYYNMALCYSNLGNYEEAYKKIKSAEKITDGNNEKFHFIYAAIIQQAQDKEKFEEAYSHVIRALEICPTYYKAQLLKFHYEALLDKKEYSTINSEMESEFILLLREKSDDNKISDYYETIGFIQSKFSMHLEAVHSFEKAWQHENSIFHKVDMAYQYYYLATQGTKGARIIHKSSIDFNYMIIARELFEETLSFNNGDLNRELERHVMPYYISCLAFCNEYTKISMIVSKSDISAYDQETTINIIFARHISGEANSSDLELLNEDDKKYIEVCSLLEKDNKAEAKEKIVSFIGKIKNEDRLRYY